MKEQSKNKEVSLLLAVFLSLWTWLYTAEKDWWKFVVSLVLYIGAFLVVYFGIENKYVVVSVIPAVSFVI
jgi:Ca2+/Na+ antiporter